MDRISEFYRLMDQLALGTAPNARDHLLDKMQRLEPDEQEILAMLEYAKMPSHNALRSRAFLEILNRIGAPMNASGIGYIVSEASDINSPNWEIARQMLMQMGRVGISEIRNALRAYSQDCDEYNLYIQGLCQLLEDLEPQVSRDAVPELLALLEVGTDQNYVDEFALWPLQKIGSPDADAVIPILINKVLAGERSLRIREKSAHALRRFDRNMLASYLEKLKEMQTGTEQLNNTIRELIAWVEDRGSS